MEVKKIRFKQWFKDGKVKYYVNPSMERISYRARHGSWVKTYIHVSYGRHMNVYGDKVDFHNSGTYFNEKDLLWAITAFTEKD